MEEERRIQEEPPRPPRQPRTLRSAELAAPAGNPPLATAAAAAAAAAAGNGASLPLGCAAPRLPRRCCDAGQARRFAARMVHADAVLACLVLLKFAQFAARVDAREARADWREAVGCSVGQQHAGDGSKQGKAAKR